MGDHKKIGFLHRLAPRLLYNSLVHAHACGLQLATKPCARFMGEGYVDMMLRRWHQTRLFVVVLVPW